MAWLDVVELCTGYMHSYLSPQWGAAAQLEGSRRRQISRTVKPAHLATCFVKVQPIAIGLTRLLLRATSEALKRKVGLRQ